MTPLSADRVHRRVNAAPAQRADSSFSRLVRAAWQLVAMACLALALIAGIVAMHSLVSPTSHSDMAMSASMSTGSSAADHSAQIGSVTSSPDCVGCGDDASLALMWCVLALLTVSLLLAAPKLLRGWGQYIEQRLIAPTPFPRRALAVPPRPDLTTLCISRT
ncbi:DUF6153 family protein [Salinibacterium sp. M195]|uniref:DUF6153 family protein n=1 Tax=Salinibacterium sp. M195 TaxID=2583374 RepID=UPI001C628BE6|nr:DUF6153 family protein [Salinibacterium sp. M195]QYH35016.1 hypothetical protein FFT87_03080 [Salinibacterium sp. M195]